MFKLSHNTLIIISGLVWFAVGCFLLTLGLNLLGKGVSEHILSDSSLPLLRSLSPYIGGIEQAAILLIVLGLIIGHFKGRFVLGKSAKKGVERIRNFENPTSASNIYSAKYYILLAVMIGLGISIKYLGLPNDVRGLVDVAIGAALINGAVIYFQHVSFPKKQAN